MDALIRVVYMRKWEINLKRFRRLSFWVIAGVGRLFVWSMLEHPR